MVGDPNPCPGHRSCRAGESFERAGQAVSVVAGEEFVCTVPQKGDGDVLTSERTSSVASMDGSARGSPPMKGSVGANVRRLP
jgi:hypothetical protein